jgi:tetratricopeptide (TPR) repeat protein/class 3 adenylate cyclase
LNLVSEASSIPSGISQIIIARIDRLSAEMKETVKTASVLGREFALRVLEKMLGSGIGLKEINILNELETGKNDKLWENLTELKYIFKHALIRETVYEIQLKETLRKLHDLAGNIIEDIYSDNIKEPHFEELADHYDKAENEVKAIEYLEKAGYNAKINFRNEIAIVFYEKLLKYLSHNNYSEKKINTLIRIGDIFELTGKWDDSLNLYETALSLSEKIKSDLLTAKSLYKISFLTINRGDILKSIEMSEKALKLSERSNDYLLYSNILGALGVAYKEMNDYEKALNYLYIQRDKSSEYGDMRGCSDSIVNIGNIHLNKGDMNKAMECYTEANRISSDLGDKISLAKITGNLGLVYSNLGNYEKAKAFYKESMDICLQLGDKRGYSMSAGNLGLIYWSTSEYEKAQLCFEQKINVSLELGDKNGYSIALGNMGLIYDAKGNKEKAMEFLEASRTICKEIKDRRGYARACGNMGTIYLSIGDYKKAIDCFNENIEIYEELGEKRGYAIGIGNMGNIYENMGDYDNALKSYEKKMIICKELGIKKSYSIALNNIGNIYSIKNEFDKAMKCFDEAIDIGTELMIKDFLCEFYYSKAFLLYKLNNFSDAVSNADLAYKIAEEIESKTEMFNSQVLKHKINALEYPEKSVVSFENMLLNETEEKHVADLHYEIFVINRSVKNQKKALDLYEILYLKTPDILFKNRIAELKQDNCMKNFIPDFIAEKASENNHSGTFAASAMFIDISGFTSMTQSLMGHGKEGAEVLSNIINNIFTPSIKAIYDNGGFVSTFAGDAFTAIFDTERADYALKAAYEINKLFVDSGTVKTKFGEFELAVKIGLSHGEVEFGIIDAEVQKAFYFRGEAVDACAKSEHHSEKMQISADGKFIEKLSVQVEKQPKEEHWFILTPKVLELSPIEPVSKSQIPEEIEKHVRA